MFTVSQWPLVGWQTIMYSSVTNSFKLAFGMQHSEHVTMNMVQLTTSTMLATFVYSKQLRDTALCVFTPLNTAYSSKHHYTLLKLAP